MKADSQSESRTLYLECHSGISGDMTVGALLDLNIMTLEELNNELDKLGIDGQWETGCERVIKNGISAAKFDVHDLENDHGHTHAHTDGDPHHHHNDGDEGHTHSADHGSEHSHNHGHHHRTYTSIKNMIEDSGLDSSVQKDAVAMLKVIGEAEAAIHGMKLDQVHFHEVGAIDSIIDIVSTAILMNRLNPDKVLSTPIPVGNGQIHIDHGLYPVPAPATLAILKGVPIKQTDVKSELTTPTGAAIVKHYVDKFSGFPDMTVQNIGYGAGTKTFPKVPNVVRMTVGSH
ncbi:LarC family nickel insertion protein [Alteribacter natronophilus]|uniref:LarC family nickel insertion protein n=1 Tax=Alteribacter natronophilus TaxID=2583810 RepID=UPI00110E025B|nr:LarC family nickel insertion protein [Alteribacter natronophilus]TMW72268.1 LarC family nickel insertion protein [Alteribacter natronophilus]